MFSQETYNLTADETSDSTDKNIDDIVDDIVDKLFPIPPINTEDTDNSFLKNRITKKLFKLMTQFSLRNVNNEKKLSMWYNDPDIIDEDILEIGKINGKYLEANFKSFNIRIDMVENIKKAFLDNKLSFINLLLRKNINIFNIEPRIMTMCAQSKNYDILNILIERGYPIDFQEYQCIYLLARDGQLDIIKLILQQYNLTDNIEIVGKVSIMGVIHEHIDFLEYFLNREVFRSAPDQMFELFIRAIEHNDVIESIKFFTNSGIDIRQKNYLAVKTAISHRRSKIVKHFYSLDGSIIDLMNDDEKMMFNIVKLERENKWIGIGNCCNIGHDEIMENDNYFECEKGLHFYKEDMWNGWISVRPSWVCPHCFSSIIKTIYRNKN